ncbi:MAG: hypothetical protein HKN70_07470, partial [Gammaproteobacteria bacterium]|nr:hypothetical protein [Gammaproteobacteria bacterium]
MPVSGFVPMINGDTQTPLEIVQYSPALKGWFERLNREWLERYFVVEAIDTKVLQNPEQEILSHGGRVLFGRHAGAIVGTCALKHHGDGVYELIKMAVTADAQG